MCLLFLTALFSCQSNYQKKYENFFSSEDSAAETEVKNLIFKMNEAFNRGDYKTSVCAYGYSKKELNDYVDIQKEIAKTLSVKKEIVEIELSKWSDTYIEAYIVTDITMTNKKDKNDMTVDSSSETLTFKYEDGEWMIG